MVGLEKYLGGSKKFIKAATAMTLLTMTSQNAYSGFGLFDAATTAQCDEIFCDTLGCDPYLGEPATSEPLPLSPEQPVAPEYSPIQDQPLTLSNPNSGITERFASMTGDTFAVNQHAGTYIDNAIVGNQMRMRFDAAYDNPLPDRAEFFYAQCGCFTPGRPGPGPERVETNINSYQEFTGYLETKLLDRLSAFVEIPIRLINPEVNDNTAGLSDIRTGFKYALIQQQKRYLTFQFKVYAPSGDAKRGLGTDHVSLEPGFLFLKQTSDKFRMFGEFRTWIPVGGNKLANGDEFAGPIVRYGLGGSYDIWQCCQRCPDKRLSLVTELVGWTVLDGYVFDGRTAQLLPADGDTIVNAKIGTRYTSGQQSMSVGYGRALTGDVWYEDIVRLEYRYAF